MATLGQVAPRRWVSLDVAAKHIGVDQKTLRRMISRSEVVGYRIGKRLIRLDLNELDAVVRPIFTGGASDA